MIDVFCYSIADKKTNQAIDALIDKFLSEDSTPAQERKILEHTKEVAKEGSYPSKEYYDTFYTYQGIKYNSLSEIAVYCKKAVDFYKLQDYNRRTLSLINESNSSKEFLQGLNKILEEQSVDTEDTFDSYHPITYHDVIDKPETKGCVSGISEIDALTNGFQDGTIASICAFTAEGKSTEIVSLMFKNALQGKKEVLFSLELAPDLVWMQFQARYLYEVKGLQVSSQDLIMRKLTSEMKQKVDSYDEDYRRDIVSNIMILDESFLSKSTMLNPQLMKSLLKKCEARMGGLDLIAFDHVGQFELMWPDCGNQIIRAIQVVTKTYKTEQEEGIATVFAVQTNREGKKRAARRNGLYDLQAISDLNEVERSSTYCIFMFTSDEMKIVQETKVCMLKHRLGSVLPEPTTTTFNPAVALVGSTVEKMAMSEDDFAQMDGLDFGSMDDDF